VMKSFVQPNLDRQLAFIESELAARPWLAGSEFSAADIQMSFPLEAAASRVGLTSYPKIRAFVERIHARPAYRRALERGGTRDPAMPMTTPPSPHPLPVRRLLVDLSAGFDRHWHGGDAFRSQYFNALSMSFPVGEQFFIDAVREAARRLSDAPAHGALRDTIAGFVGQEATHRQVHAAYNAQLERQGLENRWAARALRRLAAIPADASPMHALAVTCAYEHCTAVFADLTLRHPALLDGADPRLAALWTWHAAEETEHKAVAFDLYAALGGNHRWRVRWYLTVLWLFATDSLRQTVLNLKRDGTLWRWRTWASGAKFLFGRDGLVRLSWRPMRDYLRRDFHPWQHDNGALARGWLQANETLFRVVR
jgi:uncharacterized protein